MGHHHQIVLGIALSLGLVTWGGCATGGRQLAMTGDTDKPGEKIVTSYEKTAEKYQCQGTSVLVVEKANSLCMSLSLSRFLSGMMRL